MYRFVPAEVEHATLISTNLAPFLEEELLALKDQPVEKTIAEGITKSDDSWSAFDDEGIIAIFGVRRIHLLSDKAVPWLITSNLIHKHKRDFLKAAKLSIAHWLTQYDVLENYIPAGFPFLLRWIEWAGFKVSPAKKYGLTNKVLHRIEKRRT